MAPAENGGLRELLRATAQAKRMAGGMYRGAQSLAQAPDVRLMAAQIAADETLHAATLEDLVMSHPGEPLEAVVVPAVGCGLGDQTWPSALLAAFALDQAATATLVAFTYATDRRLAAAAQRVVDEERAHQQFAIGALRTLATRDPALGRRLAREMIEARDWVQQVYPRRKTIGALASQGLLADDAPRAHDSFLAGLGDRIQEALGVLGE